MLELASEKCFSIFFPLTAAPGGRGSYALLADVAVVPWREVLTSRFTCFTGTQLLLAELRSLRPRAQEGTLLWGRAPARLSWAGLVWGRPVPSIPELLEGGGGWACVVLPAPVPAVFSAVWGSHVAVCSVPLPGGPVAPDRYKGQGCVLGEAGQVAGVPRRHLWCLWLTGAGCPIWSLPWS